MNYDREFMMRRAREAAPMEACGLVFPDGLTVEIGNTAMEPGAFLMSVLEFYRAVDVFGMFSAIWHTHPSGNVQPSDTDRSTHIGSYPHLPMIIATPEVVVEYVLTE